ncbi:hypothetical protein JCM5353_000836 [Sporobolomyces roseus]
MIAGYTSSYKLCSISSLPPILNSLEPPQVRLIGRVIGHNPERLIVLLVDPTGTTSAGGKTLLVDLKNVVLQGGHLPPKIKDLIMIFGELVQHTTEEKDLPLNEIGLLTPDEPDATKLLLAKRMVRIDEGKGEGFDVKLWEETIQAVQRQHS